MKKVLVGLVVFGAAFVGAGYLLPAEYEVSRSVVVDAAPDDLHPLVSDLRRWKEWTVWSERDPEMAFTYTGADAGVDASMSWVSDSEGSGTLTLTSSDPSEGVSYDFSMDFDAVGHITYRPVEAGTELTWTMTGVTENPVFRYFNLVLDSMVGPDFETNLANLKSMAER